MKKQSLYRRNIKMLRFPSIMHPLFDVPLLPMEFLKKDISLEDTELERICAAFSKSEPVKSKEDIWTELTEGNSHFIASLRERDFTVLRRIFSNLFHGPLLTGMAHTDVFMTSKCPHDKNFLSIRIRDTVLSLAEALSVKPVTSAHQTPLAEYIKSINCDLENYLDRIENALGHSVSAPDVGKPPVAVIGRHTVSPDSIRHAYIMHRIKQLGFQEQSVLVEIGGGFGNVARYAYMQGFTNYTIVDLPYAAAIQAAFLFATIGSDKVSLFGEDKGAAVKIIPADQKNSLPSNIDLIINMDSLPEINIDEAKAYLEMASSKAKYFLSINQEAQKMHRGRIPQHEYRK